MRFIHGHWARTRQIENAQERFWRSVDIRSADECWEWQGQKHKDGYGIFSFMKREQLAHRVAYQMTQGEIPKGLNICHVCDNPPCCNPQHLFPGTQLDNMRDCAVKGRLAPIRGELNPNAKLTDEQVAEIKSIYATTKLSHKKIADRYGVAESTIQAILKGKIRNR